MGRDTGIANRLRAAGLRVIEVDDWQARGSSDFGPKGSVNHHTAGPSSGATPSLNTCINGRPDLAGPLCNVMQSRESGGADDIAYVIAAGRANHAGEGGWKGLTGNATVYGLEIEHDGISALPQKRIDTAARIHAAMFGGDVAYCCQHREWTSRKIDAATNVDGNDFRERIAAAHEPAPAPAPLEDDVSTAIRGRDSTTVFATDGITKRHIASRQQLDELALTGALEVGPDGKEWTVGQDTIDEIPEVDR